MADRDTYRSAYTSELLKTAREHGINSELAIVLAERLDCIASVVDEDVLDQPHESMGGTYNFNHRSIA